MTANDRDASFCVRVERWLDGGAPGEAPDATRLHTHIATCAPCARAWDAHRAFEAWVEQPAPPAVHFADAVMARIAVDTLTRPAATPEAAPAPAGWRDVWRSPEVAGGFLAGFLVAAVALPFVLGDGGRAGLAREALDRLGGLLQDAVGEPLAGAALACAGVVLAIPVARACYRWAAGLRA